MSTNQDEIFEAFEDEVMSKDDADVLRSPSSMSGELAKEDDRDEFKKLRVLFYIGISLVPILFLLPFLSSSEFEPLDPSIIESMQ